MTQIIEWQIEQDEDGRAYVSFPRNRIRVAIAAIPTKGVRFVQLGTTDALPRPMTAEGLGFGG